MKIYTLCHSQQSDQGLYYLSFSAVWSRSTVSFWAGWSGFTWFAIHCSLIKVKVHLDPQEQSDQGLHYLPFSAIWSWTKLFPIFSKQYNQSLHCLPFFLSSFINVYIVCHFSCLIMVYTVSHSQQSDKGQHCLPFTVWSGSTLFAILSSLIKVYTICHSKQSDQGLHCLPFSAVWSRSTLFAILSLI